MSETTPHPAVASLRAHLATTSDLRSVIKLLRWDQATQMPPGGAASRATHLATLSQLAHERFAGETTMVLLAAAERALGNADSDSDDAALVRVTRREFDRRRRVPAEFVAEKQREASLSSQVWQAARRDNDFAAFRPHLERIVALARREADYLGYEEHPYDALLEEHNPDLTARAVTALFDRLRAVIVPLVRAVTARTEAVDDSVLDQEFDQAAQRAFGLTIAQAFGYDTSRGRLDLSAHPFSTGFGRDDVRITTRFRPRGFTGVFPIFHEAGHAMYTQGHAPSLERTPLANGASSGLHESQSRLWENLIGRSRPFWVYAFPALRDAFPAQLGRVDAEGFYRAVNRVRPGPLRGGSDEITYNLHILLRVELEQALLAGDLAVRDLPDAWRAKTMAYLGAEPTTDTEGVLQDIHWSEGLIGSFPSYTLGNIASVQLFNAALRAHPGLPDEIGRGRFDTLRGWLTAHVLVHGRKFLPDDLLRRATGDGLTPEPYLRYLTEKFGELYGVRAGG